MVLSPNEVSKHSLNSLTFAAVLKLVTVGAVVVVVVAELL